MTGFVNNPSNSVCDSCDITCLTCIGTSYNNCLTCDSSLNRELVNN